MHYGGEKLEKKWGKDFDPRWTRSYFSGSRLRCKVSSKSSTNCDHRRGHKQTDRHTDAGDFIICPMLCYSNGTDKKPKVEHYDSSRLCNAVYACNRNKLITISTLLYTSDVPNSGFRLFGRLQTVLWIIRPNTNTNSWMTRNIVILLILIILWIIYQRNNVKNSKWSNEVAVACNSHLK